MREILWATLIILVGTFGFVAWKVSRPEIPAADSALSADVVDQAKQEASESASPDDAQSALPTSGAEEPAAAEEFNPQDLLGMHTTQTGIGIIKEFEGLRLEAYRGPAGEWLIGYGHAQGVKPGMKITEAEAEELLRQDLVDFENGIKQKVRVPINDHELGAMTSLAYNVGGSAFSSSSVIRELNAGNRGAAADAFMLWNKIRVNGELVESAQLTRRREEERALFLAR